MVDLARSRWVVVLPVKPLARAKSRLADLTAAQRSELALAMARDTAAAALGATAVRGLVVVTDDDAVAAALTADHRDNVRVVADHPAAGLNAAVRHGIAAAATWWPGHGVVVMTADLPALRPTEVDDVLAAISTRGGGGTWVVADAEGTGTTLLAGAEPALIDPHFGPGSFARHRSAGAQPIEFASVPGLRRDVDRTADLSRARELGVGANTASLSHIGAVPIRPDRPVDP